MEENFNENEVVNETIPTKKTKLPLILIIVAIVAVLLIGGVIGFMALSKSPKKIFKKAIGSVAETLEETFEEEVQDVNSLKYEVALSGELNLNADVLGVAEEDLELVQEYLDGSKIKLGQDINLDEEIINTKLGLTIQNEDLIDGEMLIQGDSVYLLVNGIIDEYIAVAEDNEEISAMWSTVKDTLEEVSSEDIQIDAKIFGEIAEALQTALDEQEFEKGKDEIKVNGKTQKVTKSTLVLKEKEALELTLTTMKELEKNEKFFEYLGKEYKDEAEEAIKETIDSLEEIKEDDDYEFDTDTKVEISIYTKGLTNKFVGMQFVVDDGYQEIEMELIKTDKESYEFTTEIEGVKIAVKTSKTKCEMSITGEGVDVKLNLTDDVKVDEKNKKEGKLTVTFSAVIEDEDFGSATLVFDYKVETNANVSKVDVSDSIKAEEMTEEQATEIMNNLLESPLYKFLEENGLLEELNMENPMDPGMEETDPTLPTDEDVTTTAENELEGYGYNVKFSLVPGLGMSGYGSDTLKTFSKAGDVSTLVDISLKYGTIEDEISFYEEHYGEEDSIYENVVISPRETITVEGKTFEKLKVSYDLMSTSNIHEIYVYQVDNDYVYTVEYKRYSEEEYDITPFLTIDVTETM